MVILRGERVLLRPARPEDAGRKKLAWPRRCESRLLAVIAGVTAMFVASTWRSCLIVR